MRFIIHPLIQREQFDALVESKSKVTNKVIGERALSFVCEGACYIFANDSQKAGEIAQRAFKPGVVPAKQSIATVNEAAEVITKNYLFAHGKQPSGRGLWIFGIGSRDNKDWFDFNGTYAEAKKAAQAQAAKKNVNRIFVMESFGACNVVDLDVTKSSLTESAVLPTHKFAFIVDGVQKAQKILVGSSTQMLDRVTEAVAALQIEALPKRKIENKNDAPDFGARKLKKLAAAYSNDPDLKMHKDLENLEIELTEDPKLDKQIAALEKKIAATQSSLEMARERRKMKGGRIQSQTEVKLDNKLSDLRQELHILKASATQVNEAAGEATPFSDYHEWHDAATEAGAQVFKAIDSEDPEAGVRAYKVVAGKPVDIGYWADGEGQVTTFVEEMAVDRLKAGKYDLEWSDEGDDLHMIKDRNGIAVHAIGNRKTIAQKWAAIKAKARQAGLIETESPLDEMAVDRLKAGKYDLEWSDEGDDLHMIKDRNGVAVHAIGNRKTIAQKWAALKAKARAAGLIESDLTESPLNAWRNRMKKRGADRFEGEEDDVVSTGEVVAYKNGQVIGKFDKLMKREITEAKFEIEYTIRNQSGEMSSGKTQYPAPDEREARKRFTDDNKEKGTVTIRGIKKLEESSGAAESSLLSQQGLTDLVGEVWADQIASDKESTKWNFTIDGVKHTLTRTPGSKHYTLSTEAPVTEDARDYGSSKDEVVANLAKRYFGFKTIQTQNNDTDFREVAVWYVEEGLSDAYDAGKKVGGCAPSEYGKTKEAILAAIAKRKLGFRTLETQKSDDLDFKEVSVWSVVEALEAAYDAGCGDPMANKGSKMTESVAPSDRMTVDMDLPAEQVKQQLLRFARAHYPGVASKLVVKGEGNEMYVTIPGSDRTFAVLDMDSGEMEVLDEAKMPNNATATRMATESVEVDPAIAAIARYIR